MVQIFLIVIGASLGLFVTTWLIVYVGQFIQPDRPLSPQHDLDLMRRVSMKVGKPSPVLFSDIRMLEKERILVGAEVQEYSYQEGFSSGWPDRWVDDVIQRRN